MQLLLKYLPVSLPTVRSSFSTLCGQKKALWGLNYSFCHLQLLYVGLPYEHDLFAAPLFYAYLVPLGLSRVSQSLKKTANNPLSNQEQTIFNLCFILKVSWLEIKDDQQSLPSVKSFLWGHREIGYCDYQQVICSTDIRRNYGALELQLSTQANSRIPTLTSKQIDEQRGLLLSGAK